MRRDRYELCNWSDGSVGMSGSVLDVRVEVVAELSIRLIFAFKLYTSCAVTAGLYRCCNNSNTCFGLLFALNACLASSTASAGNCLRLGWFVASPDGSCPLCLSSIMVNTQLPSAFLFARAFHLHPTSLFFRFLRTRVSSVSFQWLT